MSENEGSVSSVSSYFAAKTQPQPQQQPLPGCLEWLRQKIGGDNLAYSMIVVCAMLYPLVFVWGQVRDYHPIELNLMRGVAIVASHYTLCRYLRISTDYPTHPDLKYLTLRNAIMLVQQFAYSALHYIVSIPVINILNITGSLSAFLLDYLIYGTTVNHQQLKGLTTGLVGVILTVSGEWIACWLWQECHTRSQFQYWFDDIGIKFACSLGFACISVLWSYSLVIQKEIKHLSGIYISYHCGLLFIFFPALFYPVTVTRPVSLPEFLLGSVVAGSIISLIMIAFTTAYNITKNTGVLTSLTMITLVPSYAISVFFYHEPVNPFALLGLCFLASGLVWTLRHSQ